MEGALNKMEGVLITETQAHRAKGHVKTEAETRIMGPPANECLEPPEGGRDNRDSTLEFTEETWA